MHAPHHCDLPGLMPLEIAIHRILSSVEAVLGTERVNLQSAHKRVLASDIISLINVPPADNSAMDGYALRSADLTNNDCLKLVGTVLAGSPYSTSVNKGECVRIMTGGVLPLGTDCVVMQENTQVKGNIIHFMQKPALGNSVRKAGEDIRQHDVVITKGTQLSPAHLALIASIGHAQVEVFRQLTVGLMATGDELTPPGQPLNSGAIYESNSVALSAMLEGCQLKVINYGIIKDDKDLLRATFEKANIACDLVISCGGVSVGEADYVKPILAELGTIDFWKVAIKPGKPFAFGQLSHAIFCGLPGNPVSSFVTFEQLVLPLIRKLSGQLTQDNNTFLLACTTSKVHKRPGRADFQRAYYYRDENQQLRVIPQSNQGSGVMSSITKANCYILLPQEQGNLDAEETVKILPFCFI